MKTKTKGYVAHLSNGEIRLYASEPAALRHESRLGTVMIVQGCEVDAKQHYRGKIPATGVRFTKDDQSTSQFIAAMNHATL